VRLAIEVDGSYHYTENGIEYDKIRTDILSVYGVKVIRFSNKDVNFNFKLVCRKIEEACKIPQSTDVDSPLIKEAED
jgi:very-short-patch-repair endonuclease